MPFDLVPRLIIAGRVGPHRARARAARPRAQPVPRTTSTTTSASCAPAILPPELVLGARGYRRELRGVDVPLGVYTHVVGSDLVRDASGEFLVLEDNLRTPSGVSYVVENRRVLEARVAADLPGLRRAAGRGLPAGPARRAAVDRAADGGGAGRRRAHARRLQLRVLRARVPREGDGRRAGAGLRPVRRRRRGVHAHDAAGAAAWT